MPETLEQNKNQTPGQVQYLELGITGMTCAACSTRIEKVLNKQNGYEAAVNLATEKARVKIPEGQTVSDVIQVIQKLGYDAHEIVQENLEEEHEKEKQEKEARYIKQRNLFLISSLFTLPLGLQMIPMVLGMHFEIPGWIQFLLATPVQFWIGSRFYSGAYKSLRSGSSNMDVLVALGTTMAYGYSTVLLFFQLNGHLYFEGSAMVITLVLLGKVLEHRAKGKTSEAIHKLLDLQPRMARVRKGDEILEIPAASLLPGDTFLVRPGESFPGDGIIQEGKTSVDESMLTGESMPVFRKTGDRVFAGSMNGEGSIEVTATETGSRTALAGIIRLVEQAQGSRAPIQRLADKISGIFVPVVVSISVFTFIGWMLYSGDLATSLISAVAVLVIACPCALGLATPTAVMVGSGLGAKAGILIKNAEALEKAEKIKTLILDKTGTITRGKPGITGMYTINPESKTELLHLSASLEALSEHPLARAIQNAGNEEGLVPEKIHDFQAIPGKGVRGKRENGEGLLLGSPSLLEAESISGRIPEKEMELSEKGYTVMGLARNGSLVGYLSLSDQIRSDSVKAIQKLKKMGIQVVMITGDNASAAAVIASEAGIDSFEAGVLPEEKALAVERYKKSGQIVAMAGDGINDAPALAAADVGFAIGGGTDVAIEAADIALMQDSLHGVIQAIRLSQATLGKIRQNLFFAFIYNILGIPLAAIGMLSPVIAGAAMAMSSVSVVSNSLLLKRWQADRE